MGNGLFDRSNQEGQREKAIRLNQCFLCKAWQFEKNLSPIEIPDQAGYIQKLACQECFSKAMNGTKSEL